MQWIEYLNEKSIRMKDLLNYLKYELTDFATLKFITLWINDESEYSQTQNRYFY